MSLFDFVKKISDIDAATSTIQNIVFFVVLFYVMFASGYNHKQNVFLCSILASYCLFFTILCILRDYYGITTEFTTGCQLSLLLFTLWLLIYNLYSLKEEERDQSGTLAEDAIINNNEYKKHGNIKILKNGKIKKK